MKIFLSFLQGRPDHPIPAYSFWEYYLKNGINEAGHEWMECPDVDWAEGLVLRTRQEQEAWKSRTWEKTVKFLKSQPVDLFLSYLYPQQIDVNALNEIKKLGIPCVNFYCDHVRHFTKIPPEFSVFDLNWMPEKKAAGMYKKAGYKFCYLPMPMWIENKYRSIPYNRTPQITFIGSKDIQRQLFFEDVVTMNLEIPLLICGSGWMETANISSKKPQSRATKALNQYSFLKNNGMVPYLRKLKQRKLSTEISPLLRMHIGKKPTFDEYIKLTRESTITLGINRFPSYHFPLNTPQTYSRLRDIEAPMLGACYLTEWTDGLEDLYEIDKEIMTYTNPLELKEKIEFLQKNKDFGNNLRVMGQRRALNHSISNSLDMIFTQLNG